MDKTVALAPFILNVAPLVWLSGETYEIDALDAELAQAVDEIRREIEGLYPRHRWDGRLEAARLVTNEVDSTPSDDRLSMLFTGGVDSVYTSLKHYPTPQNLIAVWGNETALDFEDRWRLLSAECENFAGQFGHRNIFIKTNAKEIIKRKRIRPDIRVWWGDVQIGMGLLGLCIPALFRGGGTQIRISSSNWRGGYEGAFGTSPAIDDRVRCAGISGVHEAYDATRQDKLNYIVRKCRDGQLPMHVLRVCSRPYVNEFNCCDCEKCMRTMTGILVAGGELNEFGFPLSPDDVSRWVRGRYYATRLPIDEPVMHDWLSAQTTARHVVENGVANSAQTSVKEYLGWLYDLDLEDYSKRFTHRNRWAERAKKVLSINPQLFEFVKTTIERRSWFGY